MKSQVINTRAFTLVETIFASLIDTMVMMLLFSQILPASSKMQQVSAMSSSTERGSMGVRFALLLELADAAYYFTMDSILAT